MAQHNLDRKDISGFFYKKKKKNPEVKSNFPKEPPEANLPTFMWEKAKDVAICLK